MRCCYCTNRSITLESVLARIRCDETQCSAIHASILCFDAGTQVWQVTAPNVFIRGECERHGTMKTTAGAWAFRGVKDEGDWLGGVRVPVRSHSSEFR